MSVFGWKGRRGRKLVGPGSFLSGPTKIQSSQFGMKTGTKTPAHALGKTAAAYCSYVLNFSVISSFFFFFLWYFYFNLFFSYMLMPFFFLNG